jgi:hypothetical protein
MRRVMSVIFPWPARHVRQEAILDARREKELSQDSARRAAVIERDITRIRAGNHYAAVIAAQIMRGER